MTRSFPLACLPRRLAILVAAVAALSSATAAWASGDMGCAPAWKLAHGDLTGCDSMVMLSPGNDTRVNLLLLIRGGAPAVPAGGELPPVPLFDWTSFARVTFPAPADVGSDSHAAGEGSRCRSDASGSAAFEAAVAAARRLDPAERTALVAARRALKPDCAGAGGGPGALAAADAAARSANARGFAAYLHGAAAFYAGDFDGARSRFASLARDRDEWLRETGRYMLARVEVNRAQVGAFDEYGYRDEKTPVDAAAVAAAEAGLRHYLDGWPRGRYAASARGLLRRVWWLGGERRKLAAEYAVLLAQPAATRGIGDAALVEEIDNKLLPTLTAADTTDPVLLAVLDLNAMRRNTGDGATTPTLTRAALEVQRPRFAKAGALFEFLRAAHDFYVDGQPAEALRLSPDRAGDAAEDAVAFSRQMLRGMAMDMPKSATAAGAARGHWLAMLPAAATPLRRATVELALALHEERDAGLERVFAAGSPIREPALRDRLLADIAGPDLLRRQAGAAGASAHERAVALFVLLYKGLTRGRYADFVGDLAAVPPGTAAGGSYFDADGRSEPPLGLFAAGKVAEDFPCPPLRDTARRLAAAPTAATPRLCLAEFVRLNDLDAYPLDTQPPADELGGTRSGFAGPPFSRLDLYRAVIASPASTAPERAYALFRAVRCYAPSGNNACGGAGVPQATRKAWFQRLHRDHRGSRWADELEYYW